MSRINERIRESKRKSRLPENKVKSAKHWTFSLWIASAFYWTIGLVVDLSISNGWGLAFGVLSIYPMVRYFYLKNKHKVYLATLELTKIGRHIGMDRFG